MTDDGKGEERKIPSWQLPQERQPDTDAYHIWTPRPLLRSIYWKPVPAPPFEAVSSTYEIFLDQRAWLTMHEHVWKAPADRTPFGYLIGDLCEDPNGNRRFVNVTAALPARFDFKEDAREQISREATLALQLEVERRRGVLAGWYHRHLGGDLAMSEQDIATHHQHFGEAWQCAFVFVGGGDRSEGGCFRSSPEAFAGDLLLPFYEMASNESLLARGVKRSFVDWSNYSTVDEVRSEPPSRPTIEIPAAPPPPPPPAPPVEVADPEPEPAEEPDEEAPPVQAADPEPEPAVEPAEPPPPAAERPAATGTTDGDLDFDALIDEVKTARIEFDDEEEAEEPGGDEPALPDIPIPEPGPPASAGPATGDREEKRPRPEPKERPLTGREALEAAALELEAGPPGKPSTELAGGDRKKMIGLAVGALVVAAAVIGGLMTFSGDGEAEADLPAGNESVRPVTGTPDADTPEGPAAGDSAAAPAVGMVAVDSAGREMLATISRFYGRAVARDNGDATCEDLATAFVAVETAWITYNTDYKGKVSGPLPDDLAARDARLFAGVQDTEREYDRSGCPRP